MRRVSVIGIVVLPASSSMYTSSESVCNVRVRVHIMYVQRKCEYNTYLQCCVERETRTVVRLRCL